MIQSRLVSRRGRVSRGHRFTKSEDLALATCRAVNGKQTLSDWFFNATGIRVAPKEILRRTLLVRKAFDRDGGGVAAVNALPR